MFSNQIGKVRNIFLLLFRDYDFFSQIFGYDLLFCNRYVKIEKTLHEKRKFQSKRSNAVCITSH